MRPKPHVLGTCYICGKLCWGHVAYPAGTYHEKKRGVTIRDENGVRHSGCHERPPGFGELLQA